MTERPGVPQLDLPTHPNLGKAILYAGNDFDFPELPPPPPGTVFADIPAVGYHVQQGQPVMTLLLYLEVSDCPVTCLKTATSRLMEQISLN